VGHKLGGLVVPHAQISSVIDPGSVGAGARSELSRISGMELIRTPGGLPRVF
jgi:hypothetical protein